MGKIKHIFLQEDTWRLLNEVGKKRETYDEIIRRKLKECNLKV